MKHLTLKFLFSLLLCMAGTNALAAVGDYFTADNAGKTIRYKVTKDDANGKEVEVTSLASGKYTGEITIPATVTDNDVTYNVTKIGQYAFADCSGLSSITIPSSVTSIKGWAFSNCRSLPTIIIPSSVTSIEDYAFYECSSLTSITIPSSVTSIDGSAFYNCI